VEARRAECVAQKTRREAEAKAKEEAEKQRVAEEEERKKKMVEYLQWLLDEVLEEEATLLKGAERSQITGSKHKEVAAGNEEKQRPSKKARGKQLEKYCGGATVKMGSSIPYKRCMCAGQDCKVSNYLIYLSLFLIIFLSIVAPLSVPDASHSSSGVYPTPIPTSQP